MGRPAKLETKMKVDVLEVNNENCKKGETSIFRYSGWHAHFRELCCTKDRNSSKRDTT